MLFDVLFGAWWPRLLGAFPALHRIKLDPISYRWQGCHGLQLPRPNADDLSGNRTGEDDDREAYKHRKRGVIPSIGPTHAREVYPGQQQAAQGQPELDKSQRSAHRARCVAPFRRMLRA